MKILLIYPPANIIDNRSEIKICAIPLGLAYIAAVLEKNGFEVTILDTLIGPGYVNENKNRPGFIRFGLSQSEIEEKIRLCSPDVVGISGLHSNRIYEIKETTQAAKNVSKEIITIVGGGFASINPHECLSDINCDYIVRGEGEATILELLECLKNKKKLESVKGIGFKENGKFILTDNRKPIRNLDEIPFPSYHLLDMEEYFKVEMRGARYGKKRYALFCGSRGCTYSCHYCAKQLITGGGYRTRSIQNMIDEIKFLKKTYNIEEIRFVDYHALADIKRWKRFCKELIRQDIGVEFSDPHGMAVDSLDDEVLELMKKAGFSKLYISIESSDQKYLNSIRKGIELGKVSKIIKKARELSYNITAYFIIGFPGQTWKSILDTIEFAESLDIDDVDFFLANAFPGTELYKDCVEKNLLIDNFQLNRLRYSLSNIKSNEYSHEQIEAVRRKAWFNFMLNKEKKRRLELSHRKDNE